MADKKPNKKARLNKIKELITKKTYSIADAAALLPKISLSSFVGSADLNIILQLKEKQENESVRGSIVFPHQFGESKKILVFAQGLKVKEAKTAGADYVGLEDLVEKIEKGWLDFDVVIAQPSVMVKIAKLGKVLGPKQLMPNPKTGTVTDDIKKAVATYKAGKTDFKMDPGKSIKIKFGKLNMKPDHLAENLKAAIDAVKNETKRLGVNAIKKIYVSPTMGPKLEISK
jgi:large subunit ribosomal protein L1